MCSDRSANPTQKMIDFLVGFDSAFETELENEEPGDLNLHRVMMIFGPYFAANQRAFSDKQLAKLGRWINQAVESGGNLENAVSTCFLEHLHQLKVNRKLVPYLSESAKQRTHA
jgi:hypothetical protein